MTNSINKPIIIKSIKPLIAAVAIIGLFSISVPGVAQDNQAMSMSELPL